MATQQSTARPASPQKSFAQLQGSALTERAIALVAEHPEYAPALAALLQIDVKPADAPAETPSGPNVSSDAHTPVSRPGSPLAGKLPGLLQSPAAGLYRPGYCESNSDADLPFMQIPGTGEIFTFPGSTLPLRLRSCWVEPDFGAGEEAFALAVAFGKRSAAGFFLSLQSGDTGVTLHELLTDMFADPQNASVARVAFCGYLTRLMWLHGQQLSAAQVAADVEAVILHDDALAAKDRADLAEAK